MRKIISVFIMMSLGQIANAQYAEDALRFSRSGFGGTARIMGMSGAQQALGADLSSLTGNPAGLGFYRRSDVSISPTMRFNTTESSAFGNLSSENRDQLNIGNVGFALTQLNQDYSGSEVQNGWVSYTFGFGVTRLNNFYENRYFSGRNTNSSISQYFAEIANSRDPNTFPDPDINSLEDMAWEGYMIDYDTVNNMYVPLSTGGAQQSQRDLIEGYHNEWTFAFGANYSNTLYLGASLGIGSLRYERTSKFSESGIVDPEFNLTQINLNEKLNVSGNSVNLKIGAIVRPIDAIRFGLSVQTPDYYTFDEGFITDVNSVVNGASQNFTPLEYLFQYKLRTPFRYQGGLAFFFQKYGLISADIEMVDYSANRLSATGQNADFGPAQNATIENIYKNTFNIRIGAEGKLGPLAIRGGYAKYGDPYKSSRIDMARNVISGGLGYQLEDYYFDLAFVNQKHSNNYSPYFLNNGTEPVINNKVNTNSVIFTVGTRF